MKLALESKEGIQLLRVTETLDERNFQILKAGIKKILHDGKNRIILSLEHVSGLTNDVFREIAILDLLAKELSGTIVITSSNQELKNQIQNFSKPPVIQMFPSEEMALKFFLEKGAQPQEGEPQSVEELKAALRATQKELEAAKAKAKALDPKELKNTRGENAELKARLAELEEKLSELVLERRHAPSESVYTQRILELEENLKVMAHKQKAAEK